MRDRERLIARIRQIRRNAEASSDPSDPRSGASDEEVIRGLEARINDLEHMVQGLQDSVHREAKRQGKRITELEARIEPAELSRALDQDARDRGL